MLKKAFCLLWVVFALAVLPLKVFAQDYPKPQGYVSDFANILDQNTKTQLEQKLKDEEEKTTVEIAVVTVSTLNNLSIEEYAVRLFEYWKIGKKANDNGVLFLIAPNEREVRIEVGYGLEPVFPDAKAGRIIQDIVLPEFKNNNYQVGIVRGTDQIIQAVSGEPITSSPSINNSKIDLGGIFNILIFSSFFLSYLGAFLARSKSFWLGGVIGVIIGIIVGGFLLSSLLAGSIMSIIFGGFGLLLDFILSKNYKQRISKGLPTTWTRSGGGFFGGGFGSSGGFGGFGGGSRGGGGASGRW